jgi:hypothetical protein
MAMTSILQSIPTEIWLEILDQTCTDPNEAEHLWVSVRLVCRQFRDMVECLFREIYLPQFSISFPLPCRDTNSGATKWRTAFYRAQMILSMDSMTPDKRSVIFVSPTELMISTGTTMSMGELKEKNMLPKTRLLEALPWVYTGKMIFGGRPLEAPKDMEWDDQRKRWIWQLDWRKMVTQFYKARMEARAKSKNPKSPMN